MEHYIPTYKIQHGDIYSGNKILVAICDHENTQSPYGMLIVNHQAFILFCGGCIVHLKHEHTITTIMFVFTAVENSAHSIDFD
jgi:hypothetical protein